MTNEELQAQVFSLTDRLNYEVQQSKALAAELAELKRTSPAELAEQGAAAPLTLLGLHEQQGGDAHPTEPPPAGMLEDFGGAVDVIGDMLDAIPAPAPVPLTLLGLHAQQMAEERGDELDE